MTRHAEITDVGDDALLTPSEVADRARLSVSTLKDKRWRGTGPAFIKLSPGRGGRIRYRKSEVDRWLNSGQPEGTA